jgi:hypothetical protein
MSETEFRRVLAERDEWRARALDVARRYELVEEEKFSVQNTLMCFQHAAEQVVSAYMAGDDLGPVVARLEALTGGQQGNEATETRDWFQRYQAKKTP